MSEDLQLSTILIHADSDLAGGAGAPVAPDIAVSTSAWLTVQSRLPGLICIRWNVVFRHTEYEGDKPPHDLDVDLSNPEPHVYARYTQPVMTRVETVLGKIMVCTP